MASTSKNAELFVGIVARLGVDTKLAVETINTLLRQYKYEVTEIKVTDALKEIPKNQHIATLPTEERYSQAISACNELRERANLPDLMARFAIAQIKGGRPLGEGEDSREALLNRNAYVINQLKREEESDRLRAVYGDHYVQISLHSGVEQRARQLADKIADDHSEQPRAESWQTKARSLMDQDDAEEGIPHGQRVRDVFPASDVVIDASTKKSLGDGLRRFFRALFGDPRVTPTREEYGMQLANTASLRSADLSRQVGAAILNEYSEIQALGCNEVPKGRGGTYWEGDDPDGREFQLGRDSNDARKTEILLDIATRMQEAGLLKDEYSDSSARRSALLDRKDKTIKDSQLMDSLEYGRIVHAEMNAITDAARNGHAIRDCILYVNTFPCHNCAKHVVASGIKKVVYLRPYPKSYARQLFDDSISIDNGGADKKKVNFSQFIGVTGPIFERMFYKKKWKVDGVVPAFDKQGASFLKRSPLPAYDQDEAEIALGLEKIIGEMVTPSANDDKVDGITAA